MSESSQELIPEYLYHYTNIESLALILKNRTIRFNSLNRMDDLQEQETADIKNAGQFCFISSWTEDDTESIPMWKMYASLSQGVRIRLKTNPFKIYDNPVSELSKVATMPIVSSGNGNGIPTIIPISEMFAKGFFAAQAMSKDILSKVKYTDDHEKLYPSLYSELPDGKFELALGKLGKYKNLHWAFQKEWRYILYFLPLNLNQPVDNSIMNFNLMANRVRMGTEQQPFSYYDMRIDDVIFSDMNITLSPCMSAGSRVIVNSLVSNYNPSAKVIDSSLKGLI